MAAANAAGCRKAARSAPSYAQKKSRSTTGFGWDAAPAYFDAPTM
jgi:hypothetical protein